MVDRVGRLLGIDYDHCASGTALRRDPVLGPLVTSYPGLVVPSAWNPFEVGVWAILSGSQPGRDRLLDAFVARLGTPVPGLPGGLTRTFPDPAAVTPDSLAPIGLPDAEATAMAELAGPSHPAERPARGPISGGRGWRSQRPTWCRPCSHESARGRNAPDPPARRNLLDRAYPRLARPGASRKTPRQAHRNAAWEQRDRWMVNRRVIEPRLTAEYTDLADAPTPRSAKQPTPSPPITRSRTTACESTSHGTIATAPAGTATGRPASAPRASSRWSAWARHGGS